MSRGKQNFGKFNCGKCHDDIKTEQSAETNIKALADLQAGKGCLGSQGGPFPQFALSDTHKSLLNSGITELETLKLNAEGNVNQTLATMNCIACHDRAGLGGVTAERNRYFTGSKKELGNEGRIAPPLTHVGAKLPKEWLAEVVIRGKQQREYLATSMPIFGEQNVGHLVDLFEKVDTLEKVSFPKITDAAGYKRAGHKLMGREGFSCIACHDFNGQKASGPGAMEIIHSTKRLKKDWFYLFMLNPARFRQNTVMPSAWPGGHAFKKDILGGDTKRQIESLWVYLQDGTRAKNPVGLSRQSPELRVTDEPVMCRGRGVAGYRGIAIGYPERISLAFDSEQMNLRMMWKGDFATVNPGSFSPRGSDRIEFPAGIPFHTLKSFEDNWPYKRKTDYLFPQDHGYRFRGYFLDEHKRPTIMYQYGDIGIHDYFEDSLRDESKAYFKRTLTFESPRDQQQFYFRAGSGKNHETIQYDFCDWPPDPRYQKRPRRSYSRGRATRITRAARHPSR